MKAVVIYQSICHKNTEKIANAISESLDAKLCKVTDFKIDSLKDLDMIGFGSGIFFGKHHQSILALVDKLPKSDKKVFIFSTAGFPLKGFHKSLRSKLTAKGFSIVGEFSCKGLDTWGPYKFIGGLNKGRPNDEDLKKAKEFSLTLK
jgi:flavodoxin